VKYQKQHIIMEERAAKPRKKTLKVPPSLGDRKEGWKEE
jgi:hypothetical protein